MTADKSFIYEDYETKISFKVQIFGEGNKVVLVFPGGPGINSQYLTGFAREYFTDRAKACVFSLPCHDGSPHNNKPLNLSELVIAYRNFIKAEFANITVFYGVGHSLGCLILSRLKENYGTTFTSILLASPNVAGKINDETLSAFSKVKQGIDGYSNLKYLNGILPLYFSNIPQGIDSLIDPEGCNLELRVDLKLEDIRKHFLSSCESPTQSYLIIGQNDIISQATLNDRDFLSRMTKRWVIPNCGHFPMIEYPEYFSKLVAEIWTNG